MIRDFFKRFYIFVREVYYTLVYQCSFVGFVHFEAFIKIFISSTAFLFLMTDTVNVKKMYKFVGDG